MNALALSIFKNIIAEIFGSIQEGAETENKANISEFQNIFFDLIRRINQNDKATSENSPTPKGSEKKHTEDNGTNFIPASTFQLNEGIKCEKSISLMKIEIIGALPVQGAEKLVPDAVNLASNADDTVKNQQMGQDLKIVKIADDIVKSQTMKPKVFTIADEKTMRATLASESENSNPEPVKVSQHDETADFTSSKINSFQKQESDLKPIQMGEKPFKTGEVWRNEKFEIHRLPEIVELIKDSLEKDGIDVKSFEINSAEHHISDKSRKFFQTEVEDQKLNNGNFQRPDAGVEKPHRGETEFQKHIRKETVKFLEFESAKNLTQSQSTEVVHHTEAVENLSKTERTVAEPNVKDAHFKNTHPGDREIVLKLDTNELGDIVVKVAESEKGIRIVFEVKSLDAKSLIESGFDMLKASLEMANVNFEGVDVLLEGYGFDYGKARREFEKSYGGLKRKFESGQVKTGVLYGDSLIEAII